MTIPWGTIRSLLIFFGPILLPKAISYYRSAVSSPRRHGLSIVPVPPAVRRSLWLLAVASVLCLVLALPVFAPENLFRATSSRLQVPTDVLFNRVSAIRSAAKAAAAGPDGSPPPPTSALTPRDEALRARFVSLENRLLYLQHGPAPLADCGFCGGTGADSTATDDARAYLYYAVPTLLLPHLLNLAVVGFSTAAPSAFSFFSTPSSSPQTAGRPPSARTGALANQGPRWRTPFTAASLLLAAADVYLVATYDRQGNARATRLSELDFFAWRMRASRLLALALLDGVLAALLFSSSTHRAFALPPPSSQRIDDVLAAMAVARSRLAAAGVVRNAVLRDDGAGNNTSRGGSAGGSAGGSPDPSSPAAGGGAGAGTLRARELAYWRHEVSVTARTMEEREVLDAVSDALENRRVDVDLIERDARSYTDRLLAAAARQHEANQQQHQAQAQHQAAAAAGSHHQHGHGHHGDGRGTPGQEHGPDSKTASVATGRQI